MGRGRLIPGDEMSINLGRNFALLFACAFLSCCAKAAPCDGHIGRSDVLRQEVSPEVMMTKVIDKVMPEYPASAQQAGREGTVVVRLNVDPEGCPVGLTVESGDPTLTQAVESALFQWRFRPTVVNGEARWTITTVSVRFSLSENLATRPDTWQTSAMLLVTPGTASPPPPPLQGDWPPYESTRNIRQSCVPDKPGPASDKTPLGPRSCASMRNSLTVALNSERRYAQPCVHGCRSLIQT